MLDQVTLSQNQRSMDDTKNWKEIERSLALATQAETLREESRELRETSRLIREESARISRRQLAALFGETVE